MNAMSNSMAMVALASLALSGCDAAQQIAGEAVEGEIRNAVTMQCQEVAQGAGFVEGRVAEVCRCSADTFMADSDLTLDDVSRERIEGIVNGCAESTAGRNWNTVPAEENGG